jgi:hypothetical protein
LRENVTIARRGVSFEAGRGRGFYGVWAIGAPDSEPLAWWPETDDGWAAAWQRFMQLEAPGTASHGSSHDRIPAARATRRSVAAASTVGAGVVLGVAGLFPGYIGSPGLAGQAAQLVPHLMYLAAWVVSAVLITLGGARQRVGALVGLGTSAITFGLFAADTATAVTDGTGLVGAGLVLSLVGWLVCTAGAVAALQRGYAPWPGRFGGRGPQAAPIVTLILAGIGAAIAFAPAWDSFTLRSAAGPLQSVTAGNAFASPGLVIAADLAVMIALVAVVIIAGFWRPVAHGAALLAGAIVPLAAQVISALLQLGQPASPEMFGFGQAQIGALDLTVKSGVTLAFWIFCAFVLALMLSCVQLIGTPEVAMPEPPVAREPSQAVASQAATRDAAAAPASAVNTP